MSLSVFLAVLAAAMMHAGWNATLKGRLEPLVAMTLITACAGVIGLPFLLWLGFPRPDSWGWLAASTVLHLAYYLTLTEAYRWADMSQVYPIARGSAPLFTALGTILFLHEPIAWPAIVGMTILCGGVMLMAFGGRQAGLDRRALVFAILTALSICGYTISDGLGARAAGDPHAYAAALFVIDAVPLPLIVLAWRGRETFRPMAGFLPLGFAGGFMTLTAYWIVIWALTVAPIALVATLRETSVLFATLIAVLVLKERWRPVRAAAALLIVAGIATMRIA